MQFDVHFARQILQNKDLGPGSKYVQEGGGETNNQNWDPGRRPMYKLKRTLPPPHPTPPHPTPPPPLPQGQLKTISLLKWLV